MHFMYKFNINEDSDYWKIKFFLKLTIVKVNGLWGKTMIKIKWTGDSRSNTF